MQRQWLLIALFISTGQAQALANDRPNILLAIADDWSFGHAGAYGCPWIDTPNFDRVAREGVLFRHAYTPNAKCAPSRATILTGRYSWQLEAAGNHMCHFPAKYGGFIERLVAADYFAGYTGKGWGPGVANNAGGEPRAITGTRYASQHQQPGASGIATTDYAGNFQQFLDDVPPDRPWVFWYGAREPHRGYEFQSGVRLGKRLDAIDRVPSYWPDNDVSRHDMLDYAIEVEHFDTHLGSMLEQLESTGQLENTLIVVTSDHGMPFPRVKGQAYAHSNRVPLAIRWPLGIHGVGRVVDDYVDFSDLAPTFLAVAHISEPGPIMQPLSGRSLTDIFASADSGRVTTYRDHVLVGKERHDVGRPRDVGYPIRGISTGGWLYLRNYQPARWPAGNPETGYLNCDGGPLKSLVLDLRRRGSDHHWKLCFGKRPSEELYHLTRDPDCVHNLAPDPRHADRLDALRAQMVAQLQRQGDPRMFGKGHIFDEYPYSDASSSNFYERYRAGHAPPAGWIEPSDVEAEPLGDAPAATKTDVQRQQ